MIIILISFFYLLHPIRNQQEGILIARLTDDQKIL